MIIREHSGEERQFQIVEMFPFSSESKSMGIMLRLGEKFFYYLKGADAVMQSKLSAGDVHFMAEACLDLANEGLRTLVVAMREISAERSCGLTKITAFGRRTTTLPVLPSRGGR